ncbi:hypothetical protein P280DRAFT_162843 [Massarina eburnea CBS 473.64]|uniref:Uncharacterized protein n=1 Tax=Massarina eburnea CBS 473.64 TaxID=1395130 RepID=A0A6A6RP79_9PLEO|nr:hypothetical protein P280DRAFT_162843 [Massarina eburnea CBS 473.64]
MMPVQESFMRKRPRKTDNRYRREKGTTTSQPTSAVPLPPPPPPTQPLPPPLPPRSPPSLPLHPSTPPTNLPSQHQPLITLFSLARPRHRLPRRRSAELRVRGPGHRRTSAEEGVEDDATHDD